MGLSESPLSMGTGVNRFREVLAGLFLQAEKAGKKDQLILAIDEVRAELNGDFAGITSFTGVADGPTSQVRKTKVRGPSNTGSNSGASVAA